jgi:hypothetical protein
MTKPAVETHRSPGLHDGKEWGYGAKSCLTQPFQARFTILCNTGTGPTMNNERGKKQEKVLKDPAAAAGNLPSLWKKKYLHSLANPEASFGEYARCGIQSIF